MGRNTKVNMLPEQFNDNLSVGVKLDDGKSPLVSGVINYFPRALLAVADVSAYGVDKYSVPYSVKSWAKVPNGFERYTNAMGRHLAYEAIDPIDHESGLLHAQMAAWNALARLELLCHDIEETIKAGNNEEE